MKLQMSSALRGCRKAVEVHPPHDSRRMRSVGPRTSVGEVYAAASFGNARSALLSQIDI